MLRDVCLPLRCWLVGQQLLKQIGRRTEHYYSLFLQHGVCPGGCAQSCSKKGFQAVQKSSVHSPTRPTVEQSHMFLASNRTATGPENL